MTGIPIVSRPPATIGRRVAGFMLDQLPVLLAGAVVLALAGGALAAGSFGAALVPLAAYAAGSLLYGLFAWWWLATAGLSPGKRLLGLRVVSARTGRPIGWGPAFVRQLVLGLVVGCTLGIGGLLLAAVAAGHPRRQGWHDRAAGSVVIDEHATVAPSAAPAAPRPASGIVPVSLPAGAGTAPAPAPEELPVRRPVPVVAEPPALPVPRPQPSVATGGTGLISSVPGLVDDVPGIGSAAAPAEQGDDDPELTRMPARRTTEPAGWALDVGGRRLAVRGTGLLGRDPQPRTGEDVVHLVPVEDPQRSLSKTHLQFGIDDRGFWVRDRGSTNGTAVRTPDGAQRPCPPETTVPVPGGSVLVIGDHEVLVSRV